MCDVLDRVEARGMEKTRKEMILRTLGFDEKTIELAKIAAYLHDIGKTFITLKFLSSFFIDTTMNGHKVYTIFSVHSNNINPLIGSNLT